MAESISLSIIIPVFNERESIPHLLDEIHSVMDTNFNYEIVCVDDGSSDGTFEYLRERRQSDDKLRLIQFLRNYGKSAALAEAFKRISSDYVVTLDADLQDDPMEIPPMVEKLQEGYDLVSGWKKERRDPLSKRLPLSLIHI